MLCAFLVSVWSCFLHQSCNAGLNKGKHMVETWGKTLLTPWFVDKRGTKGADGGAGNHRTAGSVHSKSVKRSHMHKPLFLSVCNPEHCLRVFSAAPGRFLHFVRSQHVGSEAHCAAAGSRHPELV